MEFFSCVGGGRKSVRAGVILAEERMGSQSVSQQQSTNQSKKKLKKLKKINQSISCPEVKICEKGIMVVTPMITVVAATLPTISPDTHTTRN